jgi:23S rRNA pseudouridine1911/1915/1917 synthase
VLPGDPRERLDKLAVALLLRTGRVESRATVQRWIEQGHITIGGCAARASSPVPAGAIVTISPQAPEPTRALPDASILLSVVYEDAHLIVIDKPAGLVVHPARGHQQHTLVNALLARGGFERFLADPRDPIGHLRPGIVHRLDKGTSGLLVVAKEQASREALKDLFARHAIEREYLAIVLGSPRDATFDTLHGRHPTDRLRFTSRVRTGKRAVTHVRVIERLGPAALVACRLETGKTHQIRVHLAECGGTPILGDSLYGRPPRSEALRRIAEDLGRPALHAHLLGFVHPATHKPVRWQSPLPADMALALERVRELATRSST